MWLPYYVYLAVKMNCRDKATGAKLTDSLDTHACPASFVDTDS